MAFQVIENRRGQNRHATDTATVSWRVQGKQADGRPKMRLGLYLHRHLSASLGWLPAKGAKAERMRVEYDPETNRLRVAPLSVLKLPRGAETDAFVPCNKDGTLSFSLPLDHLRADTTARPARPVPLTVEAPWVVVDLPDWAKHRGMEAARAAKAATLARMQGAA